jgi:hypothetical protein
MVSVTLIEKQRNKLLRRVDWRFLLPNPRPARAICFGSGRLIEAVKSVMDQVTVSCQQQQGEYDLAVAANPDRATLLAAWRALKPGGSCYAEWSWPRCGMLSGIQRCLQAAGFTDIRFYWAGPSRSHPRFWVPLESQGALHYFLESRPPAPNLLIAVVFKVIRFFWYLLYQIGLLWPLCVVARKAGLDAASEDEILGQTTEQLLLSTWSGQGLLGPSGPLSFLLLTGGQRSISKVVALVFVEPEPLPRLAIKITRVPESAPGLNREAAILRTLGATSPKQITGVPQVIFHHECDDIVILGETALVGQPIGPLVRSDNYQKLALQVTDWLIRLAGSTAPVPCNVWWDRLVGQTLADFEHSFGPVIDPELLAQTKAELATLGPLPIVCEQRDFSPWNVHLTHDGQVVVLDWESAEPHGLPAMDLIYFLSYLAFYHDGVITSGNFRASYRATLDPSTPTGRVRQQCLAYYAKQVGFDCAALRPLGLLVWLVHSRSDYRHFVADAGGPPGIAALRRSQFLCFWEEEVRYAQTEWATS